VDAIQEASPTEPTRNGDHRGNGPLRTGGFQNLARTTRSCLYLRRGMAFTEWVGIGRNLVGITSASAWWLGDWIVYGQRAYRQRYMAALEATPLDYHTLRNYAWVARHVEMSRRRDNLSFQHHAEVAALPPADQDFWLQRAEDESWSRNELRRRLGEERKPIAALVEADSVIVRLRVTPPRERLWRQAATAAKKELGDWVAAAADQFALAHLGDGGPDADLDQSNR
jgi:hypothetical protein